MACILGHLPFDWHYRMCNTAKSRKWFIYLTNWSYFCLTLDALLEFIAVVFVRRTRPDILSGDCTVTPWYLKVVWFVYNLSSCSAVLVTSLYWSLLHKPGEHITITTLIEHALNGVYVILNLPVTAVPFKIYHMYQTMIFGVVYITFTIVYQALGGTNRHDKPYIYPQIDWNHPGTAAMFSAGSTFVAIPLIHSLLYLLCLARTAVYKRYQTRPEASMV
ncbi:protein rolling stone-like isoform X1 [Gigantopelta aegis]|uniref:protein rolling stone-like isoform X1 n=1 Tax=Gigantopelta aegis TaxID=1735272 RepID=UPI001B889A9D|nr:protein rolling stone-like isoform X1 [Gigantopelta aegis]